MSRDMKPRRTPPPQKKSRGGTLIGMFIGLVVGVGAAAGVVWYLNKAPLPFNTKSAEPTPRAPSTSDGSKKESPAAAPGAANTPPSAPIALGGKPGDPPPEKRFQFYDILQGKTAPEPAKAEEEKPAHTLFLQAGAFSNPQDAENQKAKLAMLGVEAQIQQVMVQDNTFYRVRIGPFKKIEDLNKTRTELIKSGIDAQLAKTKE